MTINLQTLGAQLKLVDQEIMDLALKRMKLAKQVGFYKYLNGEEISRPAIESSRLEGIRAYADQIGLNPDFAALLHYALIDEACKVQMIQLQRGILLQENMMNLSEYGNETWIQTNNQEFKAYNLAPRSLSHQDRDFVFNKIYPVAQSAFGQQHSEKFANDVRAHALDHKEILVVEDAAGKVIAFRIWDVFTEYDQPIIYLAGMCVSLEHQKNGLGPAMIQKAIDLAGQSHPSWSHVVLRTQNWAMQKSFASIAEKSGFYQRFGDQDITSDIQAVAQVVAQKNGDTYFEPERLVSRKIYGASLYGSNQNFQDGFPGLNVLEGDAAYCVWRR